MREKSGPPKEPPEKVVREIRRATRKRHSPEEKIRIVLSGLRGERRAHVLSEKEAIELVRAYYDIPEHQRRQLFELARILGRAS